MGKLSFILLFTLSSVTVSAYDPNAKAPIIAGETPTELDGVGVTEKLGESIDLNLPFVDDTGEKVQLSQYFHKGKPVVMAIVYYNCPNLCNYQLNGLAKVFKQVKWRAGKDYEFVAVSLDPKEDHTVAAEKKASHLKQLGQPSAAKGWHFLTGTEENIKKLGDQVGFTFKWLPRIKQYAHEAATYILTPEGKLSRYLYGVSYDQQTMTLSMLEASNGKIGNIVDHIVLFCFQFDPNKSKYTLYAFNLMRVGALLVVLALAIFLVPVWLKERRSTKGEG